MKTVLIGLVLLYVVSLCATSGVQTGEITCGSSNTWTKVPEDEPGRYNPRESRTFVTFSTPYCKPPKVFLTVSHMDAKAEFNLRYIARLYAVTPTGFNASCYTWNNAHIYVMKMSWLAIDDNY